MRNNGRLTRKQIKGILSSIGRSQSITGVKGTQSFVSDSDINAIMRRMDADGDEELSFSDFFASLLPYFIYGDLRTYPTANQVAGNMHKKRVKSIEGRRQSVNKQLSRAKSASAAQRRKPSFGQKNFWEQNPTLLQDEELAEDDYIGIRGDHTTLEAKMM